MKHHICEHCGKEHRGTYGSGRFCSDHCRRVWIGIQSNRTMQKNGTKKCNNKRPYGTWKCMYCGQIFETGQMLNEHRRQMHPIIRGSAWNKGLTKETDARVAKRSITFAQRLREGKIIPSWKGRHHTQETKEKLSKLRKIYLKEHPDKVPYLLNHSSKESYPESYFRLAFINERFPPFIQNKSVIGYFLDFAFEDSKKYVEVDGEQHYADARIVAHDMVRTLKLAETEWKCVCRIRWSKFKKLTDDQKRAFILGLKQKIETVQ